MPILELGSQDWEKLGKLIANRIFAPASFPPPPLSISTAKARDWKHVNFSSPPIVPKTAPTTRYKSILKPSTPRFQEDASLVREGSADRMDAGTLGIPIHLRKTRFEKDMVDPTVLLGHLATWRIEMTEESIIFLESMPVNYGIFLAEASNRMRSMYEYSDYRTALNIMPRNASHNTQVSSHRKRRTVEYHNTQKL